VSGPGFHILLNREDAKKLFSHKEPEAIRSFVKQLTESKDYKKQERVLECGTAWDAIHRCLTDGTLDPTGGDPPLNNAILGGRQLYKSDDYLVSLVRPDMAPFVSEALNDVKYEDMHAAYLKIDAADYGRPLNEKDFEKAWVIFQQVRAFYETAAQDLDAIVFCGQLK
jgi:hypothetical protein